MDLLWAFSRRAQTRFSQLIRIHPLFHRRFQADWKTSRTEFGQQMRSGDLAAYLSLSRLLTNRQLTDRPTDGPTDRRMDKPSYRDARTHLKKKIQQDR